MAARAGGRVVIILNTLEDALELMGQHAFDATSVDHDGAVIGTYNGELVEVNGFTATEVYDLGCLKLIGTLRPLERLKELLDDEGR